MKKRIEKKLSLSRETLRDLSEREMREVAGGAPTGICGGNSSFCSDDTCACATRASNCC